ncbi:MAG: lipid-binding SYLF domain-containing protein [Acidobacteria bacterium]|nr:lipid-binding SYLF domain-containing protein [Acidobacteriota bacterium]
MIRIAGFALTALLSLALILPTLSFNHTQVSAFGSSKAEEKERAQKAATAFREIMGAPDQAVPQELLDRSYCVAVFPSVKKGGFIVGGQYGKGLISCRRPGGSWGAPAFFTIGGGSFGLQIGGQAVDLVLLVMNKEGVEGLLQDKFEIGAGAGASAGPVGRNTHVSTDILLKSSIVSYSRSRGLFAGLELKGAVITQDNTANREIYGREIAAKEIIVEGKVRTPAEVEPFTKVLRTFSPKGINK